MNTKPAPEPAAGSKNAPLAGASASAGFFLDDADPPLSHPDLPLLTRVDLIDFEAALCSALRGFFPFSAHSFYFPHPDLHKEGDTPQPSYLEREEKLLLPLRQEGGIFLGFFVARGVPKKHAQSVLPLLPQVASLCLDNLTLYRKSLLDPVTGLYNRNALFNAISQGVEGLQNLLGPKRKLAPDDPAPERFSSGGRFGLMLIRLNGLASIVRDYGYMQADALLALLGSRLKKELPRHTCAARCGDYELALLLPSAGPQYCRELGVKLQKNLEGVFARNSLSGKRLHISPSIGYISCPHDFYGLERRAPTELARRLVRRARLAAALAAANLTAPALDGAAAGAVFDQNQEELRPVMAYADILQEGGRVLGARPLSRLVVSLGASAGARVGQNFTVWGYAVQSCAEKSTKPVISRRYKADIFLIEVGMHESLAEILHVDDPLFPPEAGDYLRLGVSEFNRGSRMAFYPDDAPELYDTGGEADEDLPAYAAQAARGAEPHFQGYADFLPRWSRAREKCGHFALVLGRFGLYRPEETETCASSGQAASMAKLDGSGADIADILAEENEKDASSDSVWESLMRSVSGKCRQFFGADLLLGRYALNGLIFFIPSPDLSALSVKLQKLDAELRQSLGLSSAFGISPYPFLDFHKSDALDNARKALDYAMLLPEPRVGMLDSLALNINADRLCSLGDQPGAINEYRKALLCDQNNILAWNSLGVVLAGLGRRQEARRSLEEALKREPNDLNTLYNLGNLHQALGSLEEARVFYLRCLEQEPENVFTIYRLGQLAEKQEDLDEAEKLYRKALNLPDGAALTRRSLARLCIKKADMGKAREELHEALLINPHDAISLHLLAGLYLDAGEDPAVAESLARQSASLRPDLRQAWLELARALEAGGKKANAREALIRAGEL